MAVSPNISSTISPTTSPISSSVLFSVSRIFLPKSAEMAAGGWIAASVGRTGSENCPLGFLGFTEVVVVVVGLVVVVVVVVSFCSIKILENKALNYYKS